MWKGMVSTGHSDPARNVVSRREFTAAIAAGSFLSISGCLDPLYGGSSSGDWQPGVEHRYDWQEEQPPTAQNVDEATLTIPIHQTLERASVLWDFDHPGTGTVPLERLYRATNEPGLWGRWWSPTYWPAPGEAFPRLYEDVELSPDTIRVRIRSDAFWSDGEPIRAYDAIAPLSAWRVPYEPFDEIGWTPDPGAGHAIDAVGSFSLPDGEDGRVVEYHLQDNDAWSAAGGFTGGIEPGKLLYWLAGPTPRMGVRYPTHVEPYRSIAAEALPEFTERDPDARSTLEFAQEFVTADDVDRLFDGDEYVSSGVWTLDEVVGTGRLVLRPNPHHRLADDVNFDEVILESMANADDRRFALYQKRVDYAHVRANRDEEKPLPASIERSTSPQPFGRVLGIDHSGPLGNVRVRQAVMSAIDAEVLASAQLPSQQPIRRPGGDAWGSHAILEKEWREQHLDPYEKDLDRAAALMQEAGYARNGDEQWTRDGVPLELPIISRSGDRVALALRDRLRRFGIGSDIFGLDYGRVGSSGDTFPSEFVPTPFETPFDDKWQGSATEDEIEDEYAGSGEAIAWDGSLIANQLAGTVSSLVGYWVTATQTRRSVRGHNLFEHDAQERALHEYDDEGRPGGQLDLLKELTIEVPPIGEPTGDLVERNPAYTAALVTSGRKTTRDPQPENPHYDPPHAETHPENTTHFFSLFAWIANWWLPVLPLVKHQQQRYLNTEAWVWARDIPGEENQFMWPYLGQGWGVPTLLAMNKVLANPERADPSTPDS